MLAVAGYNQAFAALVPVWLPASPCLPLPPPASHRVGVWVYEFGCASVGVRVCGGLFGFGWGLPRSEFAFGQAELDTE
jgi:hypothetical protein